MAQGFRTDNPGNGAIDAILPKSNHRTTHRESVPHDDVAAVLAKVRDIPEPTWHGLKGALTFAILTASRTAEVLGARWSEIDMDTATWTVPASRMKAGREHRVPLSTAALTVLRAARERHGLTGLVFRSPRGQEIDQGGLRRVMKRIEGAGTVHGFRGSFKSWAMETRVDRALAEMSLAHNYMSDTETAYVKTDLLEQRRPIIEAWARHIEPK